MIKPIKYLPVSLVSVWTWDSQSCLCCLVSLWWEHLSLDPNQSSPPPASTLDSSPCSPVLPCEPCFLNKETLLLYCLNQSEASTNCFNQSEAWLNMSINHKLVVVCFNQSEYECYSTNENEVFTCWCLHILSDLVSEFIVFSLKVGDRVDGFRVESSHPESVVKKVGGRVESGNFALWFWLWLHCFIKG